MEIETKKNKICLTMIVKNESKIIERLLLSCLSIIDCICITDTGSTDNTVDIIMGFAIKHVLPYHIATHPFKNFGYNRTLSVEEARLFLKREDYDLSHTWLLLLDADMILEIDPNFSKSSLTESGYNIIQKSWDLTWDNTRLIKASILWTCIGVTHEYWNCPEGNTVKLESLEINDVGDGGSKSDKFPRDIRLLTEDLIKDPGNGRSMFYLGQTYKNAGQYEKAIEIFEKRVKQGGWEQETWFCMFQIGCCYLNIDKKNLKGKKVEKAVYWLQEAYNFRPIRAEPLNELAKYYRLRGKNHMAYLYAKTGISLPFPKYDLFVNHGVYEYELLYELSIVSGYINGKERDGYIACDRILHSPTATENIINNTHSNIWFYLKPLPVTYTIELKPETFPLFGNERNNKGEQYNSMNPCILNYSQEDSQNNSDYNIICRTVNYKQEKGIYTYRDGSGIICTKNTLLTFQGDSFSETKTNKPIIDKIGGEILSLVFGIEDMRAFKLGKELWAVGGNRITHDIPQIVLMKLEEHEKEVHITRKILLIGPKGIGHCEKNWMPFTKKETNKVYFIYQHEPMTILSIEIPLEPAKNEKVETYTCKIEMDYEIPNVNLESYRGSSPPIQLDNDNWISIVHQVFIKGERIYTHRFVVYNNEMKPISTTLPFYFQQKGIEYLAGLSLDKSRQNFLMTYGKDDASAHLSIIPVSYVKSLLYLYP